MLKKWLLMFVRRFYQPEITYIDKLIKQWVDNSVKWFIDILVNGTLVYLVLFSLWFLFPALRRIIYLGDKFWHFPFVMILSGVSLWFFMELIKWYQTNKKIARG